jgi:hypothetical protein
MNIENTLNFIQENNYENFAIIETQFNKHFNKIFSICPIEFKKTEVIVHGEIFNNIIDNSDSYQMKFEIETMTKEELILNFQLIFGYSVEYEIINGILKKL